MEESTVWLRSGETGAPFAATLIDEIADEHLTMWDDTWLREMRMFCAGRQPGEKPEDSHWDWRRTARGWRGLLGYHSFSLLCGAELQGMLICRDLAFGLVRKYEIAGTSRINPHPPSIPLHRPTLPPK